MTVKELKALLETLPEDMPVEVWDEDGCFDVGVHKPIFLDTFGALVLYSNRNQEDDEDWIKEILT